jgi:hypothetical protein
LYAVVVAAHAWGAHWARRRLLVHCDNEAVVHVWRAGTSKHKGLMSLVRTLFYVAASHNFTILLQHIPGANNSIADALSRSQFCRFRSLAPQADADPTPIPAVKTDNWCASWASSRSWALLPPPGGPTRPECTTTSGSAASTTLPPGRPHS